jgi:hypothetical protein
MGDKSPILPLRFWDEEKSNLFMNEQILDLAQAWGFPQEQDGEGNWSIYPKKKIERWQLSQAGERWLLIVEGVPQINLTLKEALVFLKRRLS